MNIQKAEGPSYWNNYLINGNTEGLEEEDFQEIDNWISFYGVERVMSVSENEEIGKFNGVLTALLEYSYVMEEK